MRYLVARRRAPFYESTTSSSRVVAFSALRQPRLCQSTQPADFRVSCDVFRRMVTAEAQQQKQAEQQQVPITARALEFLGLRLKQVRGGRGYRIT